MANWKRVPEWLVPAPAGAATAWAASVTAGAPAPVAWTLSGIASWCSIPLNWAFIIVGIGAGVGSFLGLRSWLGNKPELAAATDADMKVVLCKLAALEARLTADPSVSQATARDFAVAAEELARSGDPNDRAAAAEIVDGSPIEAADRLIEEAKASRGQAAQRARRAARLYAPFDAAKARAAYGLSLDLDSNDARTWVELARLHLSSGALVEADRCGRQAQQLAVEASDRLAAENELGDVSMALGKTHEARRHYISAAEIAKQRIEDEPRNTNAWREHAFALTKLGDGAAAAGRPDLAQAHYDHARQLFAKMHEIGKADLQGVLLCEARLASLGRELRQPGSHEAACSVRDGFQKLALERPEDPLVCHNLFVAHYACANIARKDARFEEARIECEAALEVIETWRRLEPRSPDIDRHWAAIQTTLGDLAAAINDPQGALIRYTDAHAVISALTEADPINALWQHDLSISWERLGYAQSLLGNGKFALKHYAKSRAVVETLVSRDPMNCEWQRKVFDARKRLWRELARRWPRIAWLRFGMAALNQIGVLQKQFPGDPRVHQDSSEFREELEKVYGVKFGRRISALTAAPVAAAQP